MADYAIISLGGKQYRVQKGDRLLVDHVATAEGKTFHPEVLLTGGKGKPNPLPPRGPPPRGERQAEPVSARAGDRESGRLPARQEDPDRQVQAKEGLPPAHRL